MANKEENSSVRISGNARIITKLGGTSTAFSCAVFPESLLFAVGWSNGVIEVRNSETFEGIREFRTSKNLPATSLSGYVSDDSNQLLLSSFASGETIMWNVGEGEEIWKITEDRQSLVNGFNFDYSQCAVGGSDAKISVYDLTEQKRIKILQGSMDPNIMDGHTNRVFSLSFHPTRMHEIISGGWDDTIQFWDTRESHSKRKIRGPHVCGDGIEFMDDNKFITASWIKKNPLQIWDYRNGKLIYNVKQDDWTCFLYCCRYIAPASILLTGGSHKNMLRVIDTKTYKTLVTFSDLQGAVYFAKELSQDDSFSGTSKICFCSGKSVYVSEIEI